MHRSRGRFWGCLRDHNMGMSDSTGPNLVVCFSTIQKHPHVFVVLCFFFGGWLLLA